MFGPAYGKGHGLGGGCPDLLYFLVVPPSRGDAI